MTHRQIADLARPLFWCAITLCGAVGGTLSAALAWHLTRPVKEPA